MEAMGQSQAGRRYESICMTVPRGWSFRQGQMEKTEKDQPEGCYICDL